MKMIMITYSRECVHRMSIINIKDTKVDEKAFIELLMNTEKMTIKKI